MFGSEALALKSRENVYKAIDASPGLHFREIHRRTGLAIGSLQYHLSYLEKYHLIRTEKDGKFIRYYSIRSRQSDEDKKFLSLLRQDTLRKIIIALLTRKGNNNLAISKYINLSPSTTSFHLDKLVVEGIIKKRSKGRKTFYYLNEPEKMKVLLKTHKTSFMDEVVDSFVEIWKEMDLPKENVVPAKK
ncbi:MAG: winged helix-turn-helix transcriptional regulator [Candidatus Diapherotrites archaeon]|nr:winged helix-turn-helix transcriptional regulator [Candidatus Diapherotrites archaeon]